MLNFRRLGFLESPAVFAHRGASARFHENTLAAVAGAIDAGADGIEIDVRRTLDGVAVVHHNARVHRASRRISNLTYGEVRELGLTRGYEIPTLAEVLELCAGRVALDIELKEVGYEKVIVALVRRFFDLSHVVFTSFQDEAVGAVKDVTSTSVTGLILGSMTPSVLRSRLRRGTLLRRVRHVKADLIVPNWRVVTRALQHKAVDAGLPMIAWTVNSRKAAARMKNRGVSILVTDKPDLLVPMTRGWNA